MKFAIIGPTACGKSSLAIDLAVKFRANILSLDALSVYKQIDIASAKPSKDELEKVKHFGINLVYPDEEFSVGEFIKEYEKALKESQNLIIVGGSSFYLKTLLSGLTPKIPDIKTNLENSEIYALIQKVDPIWAEKFSSNDSYRLIKWLSIYEKTGEIPSKYLAKNTRPPILKDIKIFEILAPKEWLNPRIQKRTEHMIESGLIDEAEFLFKKYDDSLKALNSIGLKETKSYLNGKISLNELKTLISTHTIQLAKRQRTFNRSQFKSKISLPLDELKVEILRTKF